MPLGPNQRLFEYRIEGILGQGAFGTVYLAYDTLLDRPVAIKELTVTARTDQTAFNRFLQEARAAGNLDSRHIVTVYALKVQEPDVYLVTEYLAGGSVRGLLEQRGPLPVEQAVQIAADVCEGLAVAHAKGIVHRDVKPENVLLTEDGRAKVGDFGIAHVPRGAGGTSLTQAGFQPGTLVYMSPEQIRGQPVDGRSDVYQVGVLLYEMLTGRPYVDVSALERRARETAGSNVMLFQARLYELLAEAVCEQDPESVSRVRADVPEWVGEAVAAALAKEVEGRPAGEELGRALRSGQPVQVGQPVRPGAVDTALAEEHFNRGLAYANQGRLEQAIREYQAALRINPDNALAHDNLGAAYRLQGRLEEAIREYQAVLRINPNDAEAHCNLGATYGLQGRREEAIREFQAALRINPNYAEAHQTLGMHYYHQGRWDEFIRELQTALRINPGDPEPHHLLGLFYRQQGRLVEAIREFQAALRINPDDAEAHNALGRCYRRQGRLDDATREYQAALRINPNYAEAHNNLGVVYRERGLLDEAIREYRAALSIEPNYAQAHTNLGVVYRMLGWLEEAIREHQAALRINPNAAEAHYNLSAAYHQQGRLDEAIRELQIAARLGYGPALDQLAMAIH